MFFKNNLWDQCSITGIYILHCWDFSFVNTCTILTAVIYSSDNLKITGNNTYMAFVANSFHIMVIHHKLVNDQNYLVNYDVHVLVINFPFWFRIVS